MQYTQTHMSSHNDRFERKYATKTNAYSSILFNIELKCIISGICVNAHIRIDHVLTRRQ